MPVRIDDRLSIFFATFTAFTLFRELHFRATLGKIGSDVHLKALLAAIFAFSRKSMEFGNGNTTTGFVRDPDATLSSSQYNDQAVFWVDAAVAECGDDPPPLCVLQALVLVTHWLLIRRVRGRAWRSMGLCIRIAYELGLHTIDKGRDFEVTKQAPERWCEDEERRRTWWAIWEMDVFASVLYRLPCTISWSSTQVWLPAPDENWLQSQPQNSCFLHPGLVSRSQELQASGNESPKAWFIVLNSLMAEGHAFSSRVGNGAVVTKEPTLGGEQYASDNRLFLERLMNAIQLCALSIPSKYKYRGQYLDFGTMQYGQRDRTSTIRTQSAVYELALMQEVAKLMALKNAIFEGGAASLLRKAQDLGLGLRSQSGQGNTGQTLDRYFQASHAIFSHLFSSHETHVQYVNPFIAHAAWMAATVQLLQHALTINEAQREVVKSRFELLKAIHKQWVEHWSMSEVPLHRLVVLEAQLRRLVCLSRHPAEPRRLLSPAPAADKSTRLQHHCPDVGNGNSASGSDGLGLNGLMHKASGQQRPAVSLGRESVPAALPNPPVIIESLPNDMHMGNQVQQVQTGGLELQMMAETSRQGLGPTTDPVLASDANRATPNSAAQWPKQSMQVDLLDDAAMWNDIFPEETTNFSLLTDNKMIGEVSSYLDEIFSGPDFW
ncbi:uncharacterized protein A1O9_12548 [Exophiala aquamarina CBS 119918]|uniref:Xylanolytic transcriptional activator regulatory domain-containing protein n=1 Tax=Exophiala aquamarina CBS 119918 TaxID=1182545 RepID=A0A072NU60_9EURO|nr:uncharacterized protein A1O9_12548 [Exophiala aquamarina CBS 119918]KEF51399.1 hypothetical protein A1O9_12548 [Exophiala aquamarina CBS 119918]